MIKICPFVNVICTIINVTLVKILLSNSACSVFIAWELSIYWILFLVSAQAQEVAKSAQSHMYTALTARRNALVQQLEAKVRRYKELQVKEMVSSCHKPCGCYHEPYLVCVVAIQYIAFACKMYQHVTNIKNQIQSV